jgi:HK97 gp10 family phage protein
MVEITYDIKGLKALERALLELSEEYGPKGAVQAMRPAVKAAMTPVQSTISSTTPKHTGALADSTKTRIGKPTKTMLKSEHFHSDTIIAGRTGWQWRGRSLWNQALAVEYGTREMSGSATLRSAFDAHTRQMITDFGKTLGPSIEKKARALAKKRMK